MTSPTPQVSIQQSYERSEDYPCNLIRAESFPYILKNYTRRLKDAAKDLFCELPAANVSLLEHQANSQALTSQPTALKGLNDVHRTLFPNGFVDPQADPFIRACFLEAPDSRSRMSVTFQMFVHLLSYLQVMPEFLDFVFPFGQQSSPRDTHFSGFRCRTMLDSCQLGNAIPDLARSGLGYRLCYNLKSVEPSPARVDHPWSIRATALYHGFDATSGASTWLTMKGSALIKTRILSAMREANFAGLSSQATGFSVSLLVHLVACHWANEYWRWYINFLDERFHELTVPILAVRVDEIDAKDPEIKMLSAEARVATMIAKPNMSNQPKNNEKAQTSPRTFETTPSAKPPFQFQNVQKLAEIEAKAAEAKRILRCNKDTIGALRNLYIENWNATGFPADIKTHCQMSFEDFKGRTKAVIEDISRHIHDLENLLHILEVRRNVINNMFTHQSILENQKQAKRTQITAKNMEDMSEVMFHIARRTERETVVMRIITVVTLFFLPATFICTFLSTDIVQYPEDNVGNHQPGVFSLDALELFLKLCLPLMAITLVLSWFGHRIIRSRMDRKYGELEQRFKRGNDMV